MNRLLLCCLLTLIACGSEQSGSPDTTEHEVERGFESPIAINAESPILYPVDLYDQEVEGSVTLRLFITADGNIVPESTTVAESSGYPELDSAAVEGVVRLTFSPARDNGTPVATLFLQPIHFRLPEAAPPEEQQ